MSTQSGGSPTQAADVVTYRGVMSPAAGSGQTAGATSLPRHMRGLEPPSGASGGLPGLPADFRATAFANHEEVLRVDRAAVAEVLLYYLFALSAADLRAAALVNSASRS